MAAEPGADARSADITELRQRVAAAEQQADAAFLRSVLAASGDCIKVLSLDGKLQFMTEGGKRVMEVTDFEAIRGCFWPDFWVESGNVAARAAVETARAGGVGRFQGLANTMAGRPRHWDVQVTPILGADGKPEKLLSVSRDITELKQTERLLARSDERLRLAASASTSVGIWERDMATGLIFGDANLARIYGIDPAWVARGAPFAEFGRYVHAADRQAHLDALDRVFAGNEEFLSEYRVCRPDSPVRWVLSRGRMTRDDENKPVRFTGSVLDITERKQAEIRTDALLELGDRLRELEDVPDMARLATTIVARTLDVSRAGYGTVDGASESILIEPDWTAPGVSSLAGTYRFSDYGSFIHALKRGETVVIADTATDPLTADMAAAWEAVGARAIINVPVFEHGTFVAVFLAQRARPLAWSADEVAFVQNVADRTRAEIERRRVEHRLRELAASLERQVAERTADRNRMWQLSTNIMLVCHFDGMIVAVNPAWTTLFSWTEQELVGHSLFDLLHPDDVARSNEAADHMARGETLLHVENRVRHRDGTYRWVVWAAVPGDGLVNAVGRDITAERDQAEALRGAEERLRQSQKMEAVGQLTGGLAHDFNNLLTGISGSLELLGTRLREGRVKDLDRYIIAAQGAAKRAASLTHRLLAFSRQQTLDPKPTCINRLVTDMADLIRRTVGPAIETEVVGAAGLWPALIDANQLENVLLNLCINARDAMPGGGRLTIETANKWMDSRTAAACDLQPGQYISLSVTDTGTGMTPDVMKRAFDPFFTTKPLGEGTGLGLSMVQGFARQSGGQIRIYSELGQGTTMCLYLPRHAGEIPDALEAEGNHLPRASQSETVLIVDDEPTVRMLVTEVLGDLGYAAIDAGDGTAALKVLQSDTRIDLLVTDLGLPGGMNGRQVADAARKLRPELKVLFITGYAQNAAIGNLYLETGMHVLTKPFAIDVLAQRIKDVISAW